MTTNPISFNASLVSGSSMSFGELAELASSTGFDAVDVPADAPLREGPAAIASAVARTGLAVGEVAAPVDLRVDDAAFDAALGGFVDAVTVAAEIGAGAVGVWLFPSSELPAADTRARVERRLARLGELAAGRGVGVAVEFLGPAYLRRVHSHEFLWRLCDVADLVRRVGPPLGLLVDSWHWHHSDASAADIVEAGVDLLHVQLADSPDTPPDDVRDNRRLFPGEGVIDHAAFVGALTAVGYRGAVSPEPIGRCEGLPPAEAAAMALAATRSTLALTPPT